MTSAVLGYAGRQRVEHPVVQLHITSALSTSTSTSNSLSVLCRARGCGIWFAPEQSLYIGGECCFKGIPRCSKCAEKQKISHRVSVKEHKSKKRRTNDRMCERCNKVESFAAVSTISIFSGDNVVCDSCRTTQNTRFENAKLFNPLYIPVIIPSHSPLHPPLSCAGGKRTRAPKADTAARKHPQPPALATSKV